MEIYIETYGCAANKNNSEIVRGLVGSAGYGLVDNVEIADVIIINSCVVKKKTESKIKRRIQDLCEKFKNKRIIVCGCMVETDASWLKKFGSGVVLLGVNHYKDILKVLSKDEDVLGFRKEDKLCLPKVPFNKYVSIVQISEGCLGRCSYCKTKFAKGKLFSYDMDKIVKSVKNDLVNGCKEIWITSQDCSVYGMDDGEFRLPELLRRILNLPGSFKVRLGMCNPKYFIKIADEMLEIFFHKKMYKFLHIPVQSGSDRVLRRMGRGYRIEEVVEMIEKFKSRFTDMVISSDIIVGFPSESSRDFDLSMKFIEKVRPDVLNISKFSLHKGTGCEGMEELSQEVVSERCSKLMELHKKIAYENKERFLGRGLRVFVGVDLGGGLFECRDENYNKILVNGSRLMGKSVSVIIRNRGVHYLVGEKI